MTGREIREVAATEERMRYLERQRSRLRDRMTSMSHGMDGMPHGSSDQDKFALFVSRLDEIEREYALMIVESEALRLKVEQEISKTLTPRQQRIVRLRLMENRNWKAISKLTHYEESSCRKTLRQALKKLEESNEG